MSAQSVKERCAFHDAIETWEIDVSHMTFADSAQVDAFYDQLEKLVSPTGRRWYFLVLYSGCVIAPEAWERFAARGKNKPQIVAAIGRELLGFIWAIAVKTEAGPVSA